MTDDEVLAIVDAEWEKALNAHYEESMTIIDWYISEDFYMCLKRHRDLGRDMIVGTLKAGEPYKLRGIGIEVHKGPGFTCEVRLRR